MTTALVVGRSREEIGRALEGSGYEAVLCPGPQSPEACLGARGPRCPLAGAADVVVLDMGPEDEPLDGAVAAWELLNAYLDQGLPVVALTLPGDTLMTPGSDRLIEVGRAADASDVQVEVIDAVHRVLASIGYYGPEHPSLAKPRGGG